MKLRTLLAAAAALVSASVISAAAVNVVQQDDGDMCFEFLSGTTHGLYWCWTNAGVLTIDDSSGAPPNIVLTDGTDETVTISKTDAAAMTITSSASGADDGLQILTGNLLVGNGTPGETINGEDLYIEGISEFDGTANFDGTVDFDGAWTIDSTTINEETIKNMARGWFEICGDAVTVNNNTVYYGPSQVLVSSATVGQITCDTTAAGNTTEATADAPALTNTAIYPLGMVCYTDDLGATTTFTLRSAEAAITPAISISIADNETSGAANATATTAIAAGATVAIAVASTADIGVGLEFICRISYAY
jgi:hypothetical protein